MKKALLALAALLMLLSGCPNGESGKYFEIVFQDPSCEGGICFDETIALEDGLVFMKQRLFGGDYEASFCGAEKEKLNEMFSFLDKNFGQSRYLECNQCPSYHLFYNNSRETKFSSIPVEEDIFEKEFYEMAKTICSGKREAELIHIIYGKNLEYFDYHIFSNDYVVFEKFGLREGELLNSKVSKLGEGEFTELKSLNSDDFFISDTKSNCPANGYFYGYVEAIIGGEHASYFTCGDETPAGKLFLNLIREVSK
ncbi:MAG: hypothetical protein ABID38_05185 [Candidatus Diapherotrites archaeon]